MKKNGWIISLLLILSSFSMKLLAQEDLDALVKKCETMTSVDINAVRTRNAKTKELEREVISIKFNDNPALMDEFLSAFRSLKKDEAIQSTENRQGGVTLNLNYRFEDAAYLFSYIEKDKQVNINITKGKQRQLNVTVSNNSSLFQDLFKRVEQQGDSIKNIFKNSK